MKKLAIILIAIISIAAISVTSYSIYFTDDPIIPLNTNLRNSYNYTAGATVSPGQYMETTFNDITGDYRPTYNELTEDQYHQFFSELPEFPKDFFEISQLIYDGKITDYSRVSPSYWKQPEFYPGWFTSINNTYIDNDPNYWTPEGYGCYPAIKEISAPSDTTITVNTYFRTGYATESYQGLIIHPYLPDTAKDLRGNTLFTQPDSSKKYISVAITNPDNPIYNSFKSSLPYNNVADNDWFCILKPTYQLLKNEYNEVTGESGFPSDWVRLLEYEITIAPDTPSGDYICAIKINEPCHQINQEFYFSPDHEYYGRAYYPGGGILKSNIPHFQVVIHVE